MSSLSLPEARKLALLSQGLSAGAFKAAGINKTLAAIEQLGYVQIDTLSVVQRAHHHLLWSRNPGYRLEHLDRLVERKQVFEYWSHAAAYLPMSQYRFSLPRKAALRTGEQNHWHRKDHQLMTQVLERIRAEGPLMARDFDSPGSQRHEWSGTPFKAALQNLFMQGDLMVVARERFHKVYDLTERALPDGVDTRTPDSTEYARFLVLSYLRAHGLGSMAEFTYLLKGVKPCVALAVAEMVEEGIVQPVEVGGAPYFTTDLALALLERRLSRKEAKILSPFDNLLIQRKRVSALFGFDYQLECYLPKAKRQYGYFCLPVLWDGRLVARADCKAHRQQRHLEVMSLHMEQGLRRRDAFMQALEQELSDFAEFNHCDSVSIGQVR
ncbi:winged helix-turn-helix domain-containing protein [Ferrimonas futtsuensis]|uniref:winged helix-turn-helix domain-containing protein n=1 Tax=Ferrimonas futtsuensis TaxID=364764 RepID=UPI00040489C8|nr:crosslink repair DNA glycosylase YcaQ family protein [Ferrimonas futtsuensis]